MCNINVVIRKDGKALSPKMVELINVMSYMSSLHNKDGNGFLARRVDSNTIYHHTLAPLKIDQSEKLNVIVTHQRLSTSGHNKENLHPYLRDDFALVHNGIFNSLGDKDKSDTAYYADKVQEKFNSIKDIVKAIQETHKEVTGYYSIVLYEYSTSRFLYYKNPSASMNAIETADYLIMATDKDNIEFAKWYLDLKPTDYSAVVFDERVIYDLKNLKQIGTIEDKAYTIQYYKPKNNFYWDGEDYYHYSDEDGVIKTGFVKSKKDKKNKQTTFKKEVSKKEDKEN